MIEDLIIGCLTPEQRRVLQFMAHVGMVGGTEEEVAAYLITRGIDDLLRCGMIKLCDVDAESQK